MRSYEKLRASALRTLSPYPDAYDAVLDEVHELAFRCYAYQLRYAQEQNRRSRDYPTYPDPHDLAFRETSSLYAALMLELRRDGLRGLARELRGDYRALRAANV
ncbi:MAG: hypothetical protein AVDCRST_MAG93-2957 [uncultured Chloroflexia bacterium]|uniref:Uncharacterized protein n=1 Tax=uncultured Chloroflexia bacterium TaxID=1672391 RepID=A0A6J4JER3_9CHLR|nr:MAG: hypothetical protein AVDCRST_MAG93-2957 [uncultured Chloroflexia bacterium]